MRVRAIRIVRDLDPTWPRPRHTYHEDLGPVLWWTFPIQEAPYCGSPLDEDWPGYHTHWTPIVLPMQPSDRPDAIDRALEAWFGGRHIGLSPGDPAWEEARETMGAALAAANSP